MLIPFGFLVKTRHRLALSFYYTTGLIKENQSFA